MNAEISFFGLLGPSFLICALLAYAVTGALNRMLGAAGFYRLVWHRSLFNFAMFVCLLGASVIALSGVSL